MLVIGIAGKKRHGKDAIAEILTNLAEADGIIAVRRAFADSLKEECAEMMAVFSSPDPLVDSYHKFLSEMNDGDTKEKYRLLLQWWGTEFKRQMVKDSYWTDRFEEWVRAQHVPTQKIVLVPDVRFPNEVEVIKRLGGITIHVSRPGLVAPLDCHASELALDEFKAWDYDVVNTTLDVLEIRVKAIYSTIKAAWLR